MNRRLWLLVLVVLILTAFGIYYVASQIFQTTPNPAIWIESPPPISILTDFTTMQNLTVGNDENGSIKLVLHQGDIGSLRINLSQHYTTEKLFIRLFSYGDAPNFFFPFNISIDDLQNANLPKGIISSINPSTLEMVENTTYSVYLTITANSNAEVGLYRLHLNAIAGEFSTSSLGDYPFTLEIIAKAQSSQNINKSSRS